MPKREETNTEYRSLEKNLKKAHGDQRTDEERESGGTLDMDERAARSRDKTFDAYRDYDLRGEDKEDFKMYDPNQEKADKAQEQQREQPADRLTEIDQKLAIETDRDTRRDLVAERMELTQPQEHGHGERSQELNHEQNNDRSFDR